MIQLTERATKEIRRIIQEQNMSESTALRVGVKGGGCSGFSYHLYFTTETKPGDLLLEKGGFRFAVDPKSLTFLKGMVLDFSAGLNGKGFEFHNPNAKASCGCGKSFAV